MGLTRFYKTTVFTFVNSGLCYVLRPIPLSLPLITSRMLPSSGVANGGTAGGTCRGASLRR